MTLLLPLPFFLEKRVRVRTSEIGSKIEMRTLGGGESSSDSCGGGDEALRFRPRRAGVDEGGG